MSIYLWLIGLLVAGIGLYGWGIWRLKKIIRQQERRYIIREWALEKQANVHKRIRRKVSSRLKRIRLPPSSTRN